MRFHLVVLVWGISGFFATAGEPEPYSVKRYNLLWQTDVFQKPVNEQPATAAKVDTQKQPAWTVAGVYSIDGKQGAVVMHRVSGVIEEVGIDFVSPSGIILTKIHQTAAGQLPRIEVKIDGEHQVLTGHRSAKGSGTAKVQSIPAKSMTLGQR